MSGLEKGLGLLRACLKDEEEETKPHIFIVMGASVSLLNITYMYFRVLASQ